MSDLSKFVCECGWEGDHLILDGIYHPRFDELDFVKLWVTRTSNGEYGAYVCSGEKSAEMFNLDYWVNFALKQFPRNLCCPHCGRSMK